MTFPPKNKLARIVFRVVWIVTVTYAFGWVMNKSVLMMSDNTEPPGFGAGVIHGTLMPGAMPSLLFGRQVEIYSARNKGRLYNLGYTCGVNACGALFFGMFYWRLNRWKKAYGS